MRQTASQTISILPLLADGRFHSGQALAHVLGVSRSAISKRMEGLRELGLEVYRVRGRGYRLTKALDLLEREVVLAQLTPASLAMVTHLEIVPVIDSTNVHLMRAPPSDEGARVCLAELQTAGRGRRGRSWLTPFAGGICLSVAWQFDSLPPAFTALGMAMAVAAVRALAARGVNDLSLKWPNDLLWRAHKLGGVLIEMQGEPPGPCRVVAGIGINVASSTEVRTRIGRPVADLTSAFSVTPASRSLLAGSILNEVLAALVRFEQSGLEPFRSDWMHWDALTGLTVNIEQGTHVRSGVALGIDLDGALLVESEGQVQRYFSGDVSVRAGAASE